MTTLKPREKSTTELITTTTIINLISLSQLEAKACNRWLAREKQTHATGDKGGKSKCLHRWKAREKCIPWQARENGVSQMTIGLGHLHDWPKVRIFVVIV